jgi:hypothetical protein
LILEIGGISFPIFSSILLNKRPWWGTGFASLNPSRVYWIYIVFLTFNHFDFWFTCRHVLHYFKEIHPYISYPNPLHIAVYITVHRIASWKRGKENIWPQSEFFHLLREIRIPEKSMALEGGWLSRHRKSHSNSPFCKHC